MHGQGPPEDEIRWILKEVETYLSSEVRVRRADVLSAAGYAESSGRWLRSPSALSNCSGVWPAVLIGAPNGEQKPPLVLADNISTAE